MERKESFPCLVCGMTLYRVTDDNVAQPNDAVMCATSGNYGSTAFDSLIGEIVRFSICDNCFIRASDQGRLYVRQESVPVVAELYPEWGEVVIGSHAVERSYTTWTPGMDDPIEREYLEVYEIAAKLDDPDYRWFDRSLILKQLEERKEGT